MVIISELPEHDRNNAFNCVKKVIEHMEQTTFPTKLEKVIVWSDGCAAQFRLRFVFALMTYYSRDFHFEWNYNERHYGKGPMDGLGGTVKHMVFQKVKSNVIVINSPLEFAKYAFEFMSITSVFLSEIEVQREPEDVAEAQEIENTLKIDRVIRNYNGAGVCYLQFFEYSDDEEPFFTQYYKLTPVSVHICATLEKYFSKFCLALKVSIVLPTDSNGVGSGGNYMSLGIFFTGRHGITIVSSKMYVHRYS